jgi:predicted NUDIX family phosphoesterase
MYRSDPVPEAPAVSETSSERVLVVPAAELDRLGRFQGFHSDADRYLSVLLRPENTSFRPRSQVETDPSFKQIIPYVVIRSRESVFCYTRGGSQGEARLHRLRSLGVGGHVDEADAEGRCGFDAYDVAMRRELAEEVEVRSPGVLRLAGLINDDATPVGEVHLGVVHIYDLDEPEVSPRESGLADAGFAPIPDLAADRERFETWSRFCIDALLTGR